MRCSVYWGSVPRISRQPVVSFSWCSPSTTSCHRGGATLGGIPTIGAVPIGTPLVVGPAALATLALLVQSYGYPVTLAALGANMALAFGVLSHADKVGRVFGAAGSEVIAKVANLLLAAFGVSLIRRGVMDLLKR